MPADRDDRAVGRRAGGCASVVGTGRHRRRGRSTPRLRGRGARADGEGVRESAEFTEFDGYAPERGRSLDPVRNRESSIR